MINENNNIISSKSNRWHKNNKIIYKKRTIQELNNLIDKMIKEYKAKGHIKKLSGQIQSDPNWNNLITDKTAGKKAPTVNILLSLGGTIREIEHIIIKLFPLIYPKEVDFVNNKGKTPAQRLIDHVKYMAGAHPTNRPKNGLEFESSDSIENIDPDTYIRALRTW